jgi:hypothetical protein
VKERKIISDDTLAHPEEFPREDNQTHVVQYNHNGIRFKEIALNILKNLKSKMKTLTIIVSNSNN